MSDTSRPSRFTPSTFIKAVGALLVLFNLLALFLAVWGLLLSHRHHMERAESTTSNLAQVLEDNVEDTIQRIDLAIRSIQDETHHDPTGRRVDALVQTQFQRVGILASLQVADATGRIRQAAPSGSGANVADQAFFQHLQASSGEDLYLSPPVLGPGRTWGIVLARRLERGKGEFDGAIFAVLPTEQLARTMSRLDVGQKGSVSLRGGDHSLLARYPDFEGQQKMTGDIRLEGGYLKAMRSRSPSAQFTEQSVLDGTLRTYTLRKTDNPRFYILVGLAQSEYLRTWRHQVAFTVLAVLGLASLTLALGWQARASWIRHAMDLARLAAQEARYRLLAENATDVIWSMDPEGRLTYISPTILRQRGWTPEEFVALDPEERALSRKGGEAIRERMEKARNLPPGAQPFEDELLQATVKRKDGQEIQVEAQWRLVWGEDGRLLGFQGVTRDITVRQRMEGERERLIQELTLALAEVKHLKGMLPICSQCKKVRDDMGYWNSIESYLSDHTDATFTHGVCPDCAQELRREMQVLRDQKTKPEEA